jgi:hypothetical protein
VTPPNEPSQSSLGTLQVVIGLIAGLAALVYVTGGALLGLRLLWSDLPGLVVAQLPREFLFSFGAAQVVVPALLVGVVVGLFELGQRDDSLRTGHKPWGEGMELRDLRKTYVAFYAAAPIVIVTPGAIVAVLQDESIGREWLYAGAAGILALLAFGGWVTQARRLAKRRKETADDDEAAPRVAFGQRSLKRREGFVIFAGLAVFGIFACCIWIAEGQLRYFGLIGAWAASLLVAMLVLWIRGQVGVRYRALPEDAKPGPGYIMLSWVATALLVVPGLVTVAIAWPLREAVVCGTRAKGEPTYDAAGRFVGETKERVYIGDATTRRIISIPTTNISRLMIGDKASDTSLCDRSSDPPTS